MNTSLLVVIPPRAGTGLRHAVVGDAERAACGRPVDGWYPVRSRDGKPVEVGCLRCKAALRRRGLKP